LFLSRTRAGKFTEIELLMGGFAENAVVLSLRKRKKKRERLITFLFFLFVSLLSSYGQVYENGSFGWKI
jgi:amino acid permease